jgi:hypothetical protein
MWGGHLWTLKADEDCPGLHRASDRATARLLSLHGLARAGRFEAGAFAAASLVHFERLRSRVQATFAPQKWDGLLVRAAWSPARGGDAVDLEVQVSLTSEATISELDVVVLSQVWGRGGEQPAVQPERLDAREARATALGYKSREPAGAVREATKAPLPRSPQLSLRPRVAAWPGLDPGVFYVEMARANDVARRITDEPIHAGSTTGPALSTRYDLFGHDLEKGVVLRARLRGCWIRSSRPDDDALALEKEFRGEPLPLGP